MRHLKTLVLSMLAALSLSTAAHADMWTNADALFELRGTGTTAERIANMEQARVLYKGILDAEATTTPDKIRAATQLGRMAAYQGEMIYAKTQVAEREVLFHDCWNGFMPKISPEAIGTGVPQYFYYRGVCLGWWGEAVGTVRSLPYIPEINRLMREGLALDTRFEGGGGNRLVAGIRGNRAARGLPGLYDLAEAERQINAALASEAYPGDVNNGAAYYENMLGHLRILTQTDRADEARAKLQEYIGIIQRAQRTNRLPRGRAPESIWVLEKLQLEFQELN